MGKCRREAEVGLGFPVGSKTWEYALGSLFPVVTLDAES